VAGTRSRRGTDIDETPSSLRGQVELNVRANQRQNTRRYLQPEGVRRAEFGVRVPVRMVSIKCRLSVYGGLAR
jgi:hypothetical protein